MDENRATLAAYDAGVADYLRHTPPDPSALARWLADLAGEVFAPGARVLEVGSAGGQDAELLRASGFEVLATDASEGFVSYLRDHGFPDAVRYDVRHDAPPWPDADIVFANAVLPHLRRRDVEPVLRRLHDALSDETVLVVSVKIGDGEGWSTEKLGTLRWYTYWQPEDFTRALMRSGWIVQEVRVRAGRYDDWLSVIALPARSALREAFDERAQSYRTSEWHRVYAEQLVAATPLRPGWHVLDVAAGTGFVAREAARRIGATGKVIAVDLSEGMLAALAEENALAAASRRTPLRATAAGERGSGSGTGDEPAPIAAILGDATRLPLPDASVDAVLCGAGLLYMDSAAALAEWHRVVRPGGIVAFSTMRAGEPPAARLFRDHVHAYGLDLMDLSATLGSPDACRAALAAAGFEDVTVTAGSVPFTGRDLDASWDVNSRMARPELATLPEEDVRRLRASYIAEVDLLFRSDPEFTRGRTLYAVGTRPGGQAG